jgi:hypothetical protein
MAFCGACYTKNCHVTVNGGTGQCPVPLMYICSTRISRAISRGLLFSGSSGAMPSTGPRGSSPSSTRDLPTMWLAYLVALHTLGLYITRNVCVAIHSSVAYIVATNAEPHVSDPTFPFVYGLQRTVGLAHSRHLPRLPTSSPRFETSWAAQTSSSRWTESTEPNTSTRGLPTTGLGRARAPGSKRTASGRWKGTSSHSPPRREHSRLEAFPPSAVYTVHFFSSSFVYHTQSPMSSPVSSTNLNFRTLNSNCHFSGSILLWMRLHAGVRLRSG